MRRFVFSRHGHEELFGVTQPKRENCFLLLRMFIFGTSIMCRQVISESAERFIDFPTIVEISFAFQFRFGVQSRRTRQCGSGIY